MDEFLELELAEACSNLIVYNKNNMAQSNKPLLDSDFMELYIDQDCNNEVLNIVSTEIAETHPLNSSIDSNTIDDIVNTSTFTNSSADSILASDTIQNAFRELASIMTFQPNYTGIEFPFGQHLYFSWGLHAWLCETIHDKNDTSRLNKFKKYLNSLSDVCDFKSNILLPSEEKHPNTAAYYKSVAIVLISTIYLIVISYSWGQDAGKRICERTPQSRCTHPITSSCCNVYSNNSNYSHSNGTSINYCLTEVLIQIIDAMNKRPFMARQYLCLNYLESYSENADKLTLIQIIPKMVWQIVLPYAKSRYEFENLAPSVMAKLVQQNIQRIKNESRGNDKQQQNIETAKRKRLDMESNILAMSLNSLETNKKQKTIDPDSSFIKTKTDDSMENTKTLADIVIDSYNSKEHLLLSQLQQNTKKEKRKNATRVCTRCNETHNGPCGPCITEGCGSKRITKVGNVNHRLCKINKCLAYDARITKNAKSQQTQEEYHSMLVERAGITQSDRMKMVRPRLLVACAYCQLNCRCILCIEDGKTDVPIFFASFVHNYNVGRRIRGPLIFCNRICYEAFVRNSKENEKPKFDDSPTLSDSLIEFNRKQKEKLYLIPVMNNVNDGGT